MPRRSSRGDRPGARRPAKPAEGLLELERFAEADLPRWQAASRYVEELQAELHYGLEVQRKAHHAELDDALRNQRADPLQLSHWHRAFGYQFALSPLSAVGSLRGIGGRFNIGQDLRVAGFAAWPALYLAESFETAYREKFQLDKADRVEGLSPEELALDHPGSFVDVCVTGRLNAVFDVGDASALEPFVKIIRRFKVPKRVYEIQRRLGIRPSSATLIRTVADLRSAILEKNWRVLPVQFDLPSHPQVLGRLLLDAGFEAISYPSTRNRGRCVAVLPDNLAGSSSFVELEDSPPVGVSYARMDCDTVHALCS